MERKSSYSTAYKYRGQSTAEDKTSQRVKRRSMEQRDSRQALINKRRNLDELSPVAEGASVLSDKSYKDKTPTKPKDDKQKVDGSSRRLEQLKKWKAEREQLKKKELEKKKKPDFKVRKLSHKDTDIYSKESAAKSVMKPIEKPAPVKKVIPKKAVPEPAKPKAINKSTATKSYEKPTIGHLARQTVEPKTRTISTRQTRSQNKDAQNKKNPPHTVNNATRSRQKSRETHGDDTSQSTSKVPSISESVEPVATNLNLTKVSTSRGEFSSTSSFAPEDFTFSAASFVFNPLSPNSAQNFLNPGQEGCVSFLDHNPKICSTPNNKKRKSRSSMQQNKTNSSTFGESPKTDRTMMSPDKPTDATVTDSANKTKGAKIDKKDANDTVMSNPIQANEQMEVEQDKEAVDKIADDTINANVTVTSAPVVINEEMEVDIEKKNESKTETPLRRSSRRSVLSKVVQEEKLDTDNDVTKKQVTPAQSATRRSRRSVQPTSLSNLDSTITKSGRKTRRSLSTTTNDVDVSIEKPTRRSTRKSVIISTECEAIPETVSEDTEDDSVFDNDSVDSGKEDSAKLAEQVKNFKAALLFDKEVENDSDKKETPGRRGSKTRNKSFAGFRLPDANSVPLSASAKRKRRKTVMPKSPEEWVALLSKSPMVEMTRRTPKLNPSIPDIDFSDVDLSSPQLYKDTKEKGRALSDPSEMASDLSSMPSDPKQNLFEALADSEGPTKETKEDNQKLEGSAEKENDPVAMETEADSSSDSKKPVEAMDVDCQDTKSSEPVAQDNGSEVHDVKYFRNLLVKETNRLKDLCTQWEEINKANSLTEEVSGQIRTTVGQAVLLMDQRFKQFTGLVDNCEFKTGEKETTCTDLDGFWDMIYFQVEDVDNKFEKLRKLRDNNWVDDAPKPVVKKVKKKVTKPAVTKPAVKSKFAAFRAQMKKVQDVAQSPNVKVVQSNDTAAQPQKYVVPTPEEEKVIQMGVFFRVASPVKSPRPHCEGGTPRKSAKQTPVKQSEEKQEKNDLQADKPTSDKPTSDKPAVSLSVPNSSELLMRRTPHRKSYAPAIPSPLLVDSTPQPRPVRSCTKKTPLPRQLLDEMDVNVAASVNKENDDTSIPKQSEDLSNKKRRRSVRARKSVNFDEAVSSPTPVSTSDDTTVNISTDAVDPANTSEEKYVDDDVFARYLLPMSELYGNSNSEKENSPRSPKRRRTSSSLKSCPSSTKRRSIANKKVHFNSTGSDDISGAKMPRTPAPTEKRVTRRSLSQTTENTDVFGLGLEQNSPAPSHPSSRPSLLYTPPDLPNRPVQPLKEVPTATLISFTP